MLYSDVLSLHLWCCLRLLMFWFYPFVLYAAVLSVSQSESESESEVLYDWRFTANQFVLMTSPLRLKTNNLFQLNTCFHSSYVTSSLMRGWFCRLQLLLVIDSAVILRSESSRTHDNILLSQIRDSSNLEVRTPVFISPRNSVAQLYPQILGSHFVSFYDSKSTVEVFNPASTWAYFCVVGSVSILWHDAQKPEYWIQRRRPVWGNCSVNTFPRQRMRKQHSTNFRRYTTAL
jgi:hypothetical protein